MKDIRATDAEVTDLRLEWTDGRLGRIKIDERGKVEKVVLFNQAGRRDRRAEKDVDLVGRRIEDLSGILR